MVLTTFMRDLTVEIEDAAIVDGAAPLVILAHVFQRKIVAGLTAGGVKG